MVMTLNDCMERINQALDYPAVEYTDVSHYFDQAISELNSTLRIGIKPISYILTHYSPNVLKNPNVVALPVSFSNEIPSYVFEGVPSDCTYYFDTERKMFGLKTGTEFVYYNKIYGYSVSSVPSRVYESVYLSEGVVYWAEYNTDPLSAINLVEWLPVDVIILFVIPYVCNKFAIRDGGAGSIFREEFVQGFQQIQTSYDIPNTVNLVSVAGKKAYTEDVESNISNLNINIPTRAIYDSMKIGNAIPPTYGGFYEGGGWGF